MGTAIKYDRPVKNLIDGLSATGHVTHTEHRKTSVTIHHNAGRLSHEGVLEVWKTRPASAHFDVDRSGAVAQYVKVNEFAWATGNREGNQSTISIEMANIELAPRWTVADATWKEAARLAGWLFANVIGQRPSASNFFQHSHWRSTSCAGPYISKVWPQMLTEAQRVYDQLKNVPPKGPVSTVPPRPKSNTQIAAEVVAGKWGNGDARVAALTKAGYDARAIQALVNHGIGGTSARKSNVTIAREVIAGKWGNGDTRVSRLRAAGYDPVAVQKEVNRAL